MNSCAMNEEESKIFKSVWHERRRNADDPPRKKADALRFAMAQMTYLGNLPNSPYPKDGALRTKFAHTLTEYGRLMDSEEGCNNYANSILELASKCKNESQGWKCSVTIDELKPHLMAQKDEEGRRSNKFTKEDSDELWTLLKNTNGSSPKSPPFSDQSGPGVLGFLREQQQQMKDKGLPTFDLLPIFDHPDYSGTSKGISQGEKEHSRGFIQCNMANEKATKNHYQSEFTFKQQTNRHQDQPPCSSSPLNKHQLGQSVPSCAWNTPAEKQAQASLSSGKRYPWEMLKDKSEPNSAPQVSSFRTAAHQLAINNQKKGASSSGSASASYGYAQQRRSLGTRRGLNSKFVPPVKRDDEDLMDAEGPSRHAFRSRANDGATSDNQANREEGPYAELMMDERLKNIEAKMVELIMNEILDSGPPVCWDDIAGLKLAKNTIQEIVVWPLLRPDIFVGLRGPPKGILLFGPPGTGKTMIGKCIASQSQSTFFSISASSLTSKWVGEGEKMVRALFAVARCHQPAVIFIDEIDSLLTQRSDTEHESSRRIKTEFLVQLDGATSGNEERLLVVGATNRPQELDEAARRRLVKRLYIPLPDCEARAHIVRNLLTNQRHTLDAKAIEEICNKTQGYSGADMANLCREAALGPIRTINFADIRSISVDEVPPISFDNFDSALYCIRASVSHNDLQLYEEWNRKYGITPVSVSSNLK